jgi:hypothetical protein
MLLVSWLKTTVLVLLLIVTLLIGLFTLVLLGKELWVLSQAYTKTTKAHGLETSITSGGVVLCDYETLKTESMIQSLSHLARYGGNMGHD